MCNKVDMNHVEMNLFLFGLGRHAPRYEVNPVIITLEFSLVFTLKSDKIQTYILCVCVCERERERERVCVCVCVCVRLSVTICASVGQIDTFHCI